MANRSECAFCRGGYWYFHDSAWVEHGPFLDRTIAEMAWEEFCQRKLLYLEEELMLLDEHIEELKKKL